MTTLDMINELETLLEGSWNEATAEATTESTIEAITEATDATSKVHLQDGYC